MKRILPTFLPPSLLLTVFSCMAIVEHEISVAEFPSYGKMKNVKTRRK